MTAEIVPLREGPPLTDIVGLLRQTADQIEAGEYGAIDSALLILPQDEDFPLVFGWGDQDGERHPLVVLALANHWFCRNTVSR